jgi:hypothetical protein
MWRLTIGTSAGRVLGANAYERRVRLPYLKQRGALDRNTRILGGLPRWEKDVQVLVASSQSAIDEGVARLLRQLVVHVTEERTETRVAKSRTPEV